MLVGSDSNAHPPSSSPTTHAHHRDRLQSRKHLHRRPRVHSRSLYSKRTIEREKEMRHTSSFNFLDAFPSEEDGVALADALRFLEESIAPKLHDLRCNCSGSCANMLGKFG